MTMLFAIAFLVAILALIESVCICTRRKGRWLADETEGVLLVPVTEETDWRAMADQIFLQVQWQEVPLFSAVYFLLPDATFSEMDAIQQYCTRHTLFQCGTIAELEKILTSSRFSSKNDCISPEEIV